MVEDKGKAPVRGLEDVIAADTRVGYVDGINGKLYYAGYDLNDLAGKAGYEEVVFLLWNDRLPARRELMAFRRQIVDAMRLPGPLLRWLKNFPGRTHPMVMLRCAVSAMSIYESGAKEGFSEADRRRALVLVAKVPAVVAAFHRLSRGKKPLAPDPKKGVAVNFLRMFLGRELAREEALAIELMFVLHAEHGFNASTFAARVTASTLADMYSAITAAIGALSGPLHGGANQRVMEMLSEIGIPEMVDEYIDGLLERKERIMGFGHRVYQVEDPRTRHLRRVSARLCRRDRTCHYFQMSELIEKKVMREKKIHPNVDFYSATVQHALGIPMEYFTAVFAASRIAGWTAHVLEQHADNRLMRPRSHFVGQFPRKFVPLSKRPS